MAPEILVRAAACSDFDQWLSLWEGYNAFYERVGPKALPQEVTLTTWGRFFDPHEPVHALVAETDGGLVGLAHYIFHRNTAMVEPVCYMQDPFTDGTARGKGIGRALIEAVYGQARQSGATRVYWHTHETNKNAMKLYDKVAEHSGFVVYRSDV